MAKSARLRRCPSWKMGKHRLVGAPGIRTHFATTIGSVHLLQATSLGSARGADQRPAAPLLTWPAMVRSMSGHGRGKASSESLRLTVEVRTVNHRYCRVSLRLPAVLATLEEPVRRRVLDRVQRGKVDLTATVDGVGSGGPRIQREALRHWVAELQQAAEELDAPSAPDLQTLLGLPGVIADDAGAADEVELRRLTDDAVGQALEALADMRSREGEDLAKDLSARTAILAAGVETIASAAAELPARIRKQLSERIQELLADTGATVDEDRIVQEAAYQAERADITEELVRLRSHLTKIEDLLQSDEAVGRTLDFVVQEVHRELNTVGSKAKDLSVADTVVELKAELERIREQVQNLE